MAQKDIKASSKPDRFLNLEGLRGLAALMVVIYHIIIIFYPNMIYGTADPFSAVQHMKFEDNLYGNVFAGLYSGIFSVAIFFVLSGFVLSIGFFKAKDSEVVRSIAFKRYARLMLPALASVLLAFGIMATGLSSHRQTTVNIVGGGSAAYQWNFEPSLFEAIRQGTWSIFVTGDDSYNRVLWTMQYEFFGSFMIFAILMIFGKLKRRQRNVLYVFLLVASLGSWYIGFFIGIALADNYKKLLALVWAMRSSTRRLMVISLVGGGIFLGGYPIVVSSASVYHFLKLGSITDIANVSNYLSIGAGMLVLGVLISKSITRVLSHPWLSTLGKYTYSLYLTHILVILSLTTFIFVQATKHFGYNKSVALAVLVTLPVLVLVTRLFYKYVDEPSLLLSRKLSKLMIK